MKAVFKWMLILSIIFFLLAIGGYMFFVKPTAEEEKSLKPILPVEANTFVECMFSEKISQCYEEKTSEVFKKSVDLDQFIKFSNLIKTKLGTRLSAELMEDQFNLIVFAGSNASKRVTFTLKTAYQNDLEATESYLYVYDKDTGTYKLESINFNSNRLLE